MKVKAMLREWLLFHKPESLVIMCLISKMMHTTWKQICMTFIILVCFWYTKLRLMQKPSNGNAITLSVIGAVGKRISIEEFVSCPIKRHFVYTEGGSTGSDDAFDFRAWRKTNPCEENKVHVICVEYVKKPQSSYSTLWVNGAYVTNFDSTASFGSDQRLTRGNIIDGGGVPFFGNIAAMEIYTGITEGVPRPIKEEIMKALMS